MGETPLPARVKRRFSWGAVLAAALLGAYGALLVRHAAFAVGGSDSSGYANTARRLYEGRLVDRPRSLDRLGLPDDRAQVCIPLGFVTGPRPGTMAPLYPPGFPAHLLAAALLAGWNIGPYLVSPLAAVLCIVLLYLLARDLRLSPTASGAAAAAFAAWPILVFQALQPMSDVVATLWAIAAVLCARRARQSAAWALGAGAAFGIAVLVRPANLVLLLPLVFALPWRIPTLALFGAGGVPLAGILTAWNLHCFGALARTGYGKTGLYEAFALSNFPPRIGFYTLEILESFSPIVPAAWLAVWADRRTEIRDRLLLFTWFGSYLLLFSFYKPYESFIFERFLLPGAPALALGAALAARRLISRVGAKPAAAAAALLLAAVLGLEWRAAGKMGILGIIESESVYPETSRWAQKTLPSSAVVLASYMTGALEYYSSLTYLRWDWIDSQAVPALRTSGQGQGRAWFALVFAEEAADLPRHVPGRWTRVGEKRGVQLLRLEP